MQAIGMRLDSLMLVSRMALWGDKLHSHKVTFFLNNAHGVFDPLYVGRKR